MKMREVAISSLRLFTLLFIVITSSNCYLKTDTEVILKYEAERVSSIEGTYYRTEDNSINEYNVIKEENNNEYILKNYTIADSKTVKRSFSHEKNTL